MNTLRNDTPKKTALEKAEIIFEKLEKKLQKLILQHKKATEIKRIEIAVKLDETAIKFNMAKLVYQGKQMEQAGRNLAKSAFDIFNKPQEVETFIEAINYTPKKASLKDELEKADIIKRILTNNLRRCMDDIKRVYDEIFPNDENDNEENDNEDNEPSPKPHSPDLLAKDLPNDELSIEDNETPQLLENANLEDLERDEDFEDFSEIDYTQVETSKPNIIELEHDEDLEEFSEIDYTQVEMP